MIWHRELAEMIVCGTKVRRLAFSKISLDMKLIGCSQPLYFSAHAKEKASAKHEGIILVPVLYPIRSPILHRRPILS